MFVSFNEGSLQKILPIIYHIRFYALHIMDSRSLVILTYKEAVQVVGYLYLYDDEEYEVYRPTAIRSEVEFSVL